MNLLFYYFKDLVSIISAAINCCRDPIVIDLDSLYHQKLARFMYRCLSKKNLLQQLIEHGTLSSCSRWARTIENADFGFPRLSLDDLRFLFFGSYKIKLAKSYVEEYQNPDGDYIIQFGDNDDNILRCNMQSRHSNVIKHKAWIQYSMTDDPITAWSCTCTAAAIKPGCCAQVASIIWYFSYARHNNFENSRARYRIYQTILERTLRTEESENSDVENVKS